MRRAALALVALALLGYVALRVERTWAAYAEDFSPRRPPLPPAGLAGARAVTFGAGVRGWYVPSRNGAAVLFVHGTDADRRQLAPEAALLAARGYGALVFDLPGHGESDGTVRWDAPERQAVRAAVDFLVAQPDVDPRHVGAYGFSLGTYVLLGAASEDPRLGVLVLAGAFDTSRGLLSAQLGRLAPLLVPVAAHAWRRHGLDPRGWEPVERIGRLAPRPLLLVTGTDDTAVPSALTERLFAAAAEPKTLWRIPGAGHGDYARAAGEAWGTRLTDFFDRALPAPATPSAAHE